MRLLINKIKDEFSSYNPILKDEFKRTFPIYFLGILGNGVQAIFHFWIPFIIGQILDLLLQGNTDKNIIMNKVKLNEKVYLIYQNIGGGGEYHILRYLISPIVTNLMYEWSLGPKYEENDIWSYDITKEQFEKKLIDEEFDYIFIAKIDKQFIDIYGDLIDNSIYDNYEELNNKLLKVNKIDENSVKLTIIDD